MISNTLPILSHKKNINQTQIIINKIKKMEKMVTVEKVWNFLVKNYFFGKNYYRQKLDDYDSFFYINSCPMSYFKSLCFFIKIFQ